MNLAEDSDLLSPNHNIRAASGNESGILFRCCKSVLDPEEVHQCINETVGVVECYSTVGAHEAQAVAGDRSAVVGRLEVGDFAHFEDPVRINGMTRNALALEQGRDDGKCTLPDNSYSNLHLKSDAYSVQDI